MNDEMTIVDVKDYIWRLISSWKLMLISVVIMSLIFGGLLYLRDYRSYKAQLAATDTESEELTEEDKEELINSLEVADQKKVRVVLEAEEEIAEIEEYMDNSIKMNIDPNNQVVMEATYLIESGNGEVSALMDTYETFMRGNHLVEALEKVFGEDVKNNYIRELVETERRDVYNEADKGVLTVRVILPDEGNYEAVSKAIEASIKDVKKELGGKLSDHRVTNVSTTKLRRSDPGLTQQKINYENTIVNMTNTCASVLGNMSSASLDVYNKVRVDYDAKEKEIEDANKAEEAPVIQRPGLSKKKCLLAIILAGMLYCGVYLAWLLIRGRVMSADSAADDMGTRCLGTAHYMGETGGIKGLLNSRKVLDKRFGKAFDSDSQADNIVKDISARAKHDGLKEIELLCLGDAGSDKLSSCIEKIEKGLGKSKLKVNRSDVTKDSFNGSLLSDIKTAVPVVLGNDTSNSLISMVRNGLDDYDVTVPGVIYLEEI